MMIEIRHGGCLRALEQKAHFQQKMPRVKALEIYLDGIIVSREGSLKWRVCQSTTPKKGDFCMSKGNSLMSRALARATNF
jgi:hypothetical protein